MGNYVLDWQATAAIFVIVMVVMWFLGNAIKLPRPLAILVAVGLAFLIKHKWWWVEMQVTSWMRFMGLGV